MAKSRKHFAVNCHEMWLNITRLELTQVDGTLTFQSIYAWNMTSSMSQDVAIGN